MSKKVIAEIPELVNANIISADTGQRIIKYYHEKKENAPNNFTIILGIIGALLVGSGIILLIAHNWDDFSIAIKTVVSFIPLVTAQLLCGLAILRHKSNKTWTEGSGILLFFAVGASISLISQVYQVSGTLSGFLLTWVSLTIPLVYLLSSSVIAMLCLSAMTWYACDVGYFQRSQEVPYAYALTLAALAPHYYLLRKNNPGSNFLILLNWFLATSLTITLGSFTKQAGNSFEWVFLLYCLYFCICYIKGRSDDLSGKRLISNPFLITGILGILFIMLTWSFDFLWKELHNEQESNHFLDDPLPYLLLAGTLLLTYLFIRIYKRRREALEEPAGYTVLLFALLIFAFRNIPTAAIFIINAWTLFIGMFYIRKGARTNHFGILNFGLSIIAALALCRFFDNTIPFFWRGLFFVGTGAGFFIANFMMIRKRKQTIHTTGHV